MIVIMPPPHVLAHEGKFDPHGGIFAMSDCLCNGLYNTSGQGMVVIACNCETMLPDRARHAARISDN